MDVRDFVRHCCGRLGSAGGVQGGRLGLALSGVGRRV